MPIKTVAIKQQTHTTNLDSTAQGGISTMYDNRRVFVLIGPSDETLSFYQRLSAPYAMSHSAVTLIIIDHDVIGGMWAEDPATAAPYLARAFGKSTAKSVNSMFGLASVDTVVVDARYVNRLNMQRHYVLLKEMFPNASYYVADRGKTFVGLESPVLNFPVEELELGTSAYNAIKRVGIETIGDLVAKTAEELGRIPNLNKKRIDEMRAALATHGQALKGEQPYTDET